MDYEASLNKLENLIEKMETGKLSLEESLKNFEEGVRLAASCQQSLKAAEQKVRILTVQNGEIETAPFAVELED